MIGRHGIAALLAAGMLAAGTAGAQTRPNLAVVHVATTTDDAAMPVLFAQRTGRFRQAGLDVQIEKQNGGAAIASGIAGGTYDIGKSSLIALLAAHERGVPFIFIAPGGISDAKTPYGYLIVAKDSSIHSARDLNGKTIACAGLNSIDQLAISAWVDANGGDSKTLKITELPQSEDGAALEGHRIDAALTIHPQVDQALATGNVRILAQPLATIAPRYFISAWFSVTDWTDKHRDVVAKFIRVVDETAAYTNDHHAETAPMLAEFSGIPASVVSHMNRATYGTMLDAAELQPAIDVAVRYGVLERAFPAQELIYR